MEKHKCKFCSRIFGNGRALGGHIRSHMMNLCSESRHTEPRIHEETESIPSEETDEEKDNSFAAAGGGDSVVLQDIESETESSKNLPRTITPHFRLSKRIRKSRNPETRHQMQRKRATNSSLVEGEPASSISDTSPEEDVAYCLMMLSKDKWIRDEENSEEVKAVKQTKARRKYRCEACSKVFRSYQALGGHRASHKKIKVNKNESSTKEEAHGVEIGNNENAGENEKIHECPICYRVFPSGQALGGHKRSHFTNSVSASFSPEAYSASTSTPVNNVEKQGLSRTEGTLIDLNLPAPIDDDDYDIFNFSC